MKRFRYSYWEEALTKVENRNTGKTEDRESDQRDVPWLLPAQTIHQPSLPERRHCFLRSYYLADSEVNHEAGSTTKRYKAESLFYTLQSRILYSYKRVNRLSAASVMLGTLLLERFSRLAFGLVDFFEEEIASTIKRHSMLWGGCHIHSEEEL